MAKITEAEVRKVLEPQLMPGESLERAAIGYTLPGAWIYFVGTIFMSLFQKWYAVGLTDRRLLLLRYSKRLQVREVSEYALEQISAVHVKTGPFNVIIKFSSPRGKLKLRFHRAHMAGNRDIAIAIAEALRRAAASGGAGAPAASAPVRPPARAYAPPVPGPVAVKRRETVVEETPQRTPAASAPAAEAKPDPMMQTVQRQKTQFYDSAPANLAGASGQAEAPAPAPRFERGPDARKIVGALITFSWRPEGQLFPVREGRNLIGSDPKQCDIALPEDDSLADVNSHITYRRSFTIGDMMTSGGTELDGKVIGDQFTALENKAKIRTGATHWTFVVIGPPPGQ
jgi:hypothetical protein